MHFSSQSHVVSSSTTLQAILLETQRVLEPISKVLGPYKVLQKIGFVAYKLELPPSSRIHPVFHVSCLMKFLGTNIKGQTILPELDNEGSIFLEPEAALNKRTRQLHSRSITEVLIPWHGMHPKDATWEPLLQIQRQFPHLKL